MISVLYVVIMCQREDKYVYLVNERYWREYIYIEETGLSF